MTVSRAQENKIFLLPEIPKDIRIEKIDISCMCIHQFNKLTIILYSDLDGYSTMGHRQCGEDRARFHNSVAYFAGERARDNRRRGATIVARARFCESP